VRVDIFRVEQYSGEFDVLSDGSLNLPLVGNVSVANLSIEQATAAVSSRYSRFLRRPVITLSLLSRRPLQIGIAGEVNSPGSYTLTPENGQFPTLTQLLETAGGTTLSADVRNIQIRRPQGAGEQTLNVDLWELLRTGDLRYDVALRDGDTIVVPETTVALNEATQLSAASFAADTRKPANITITGAVFRPGNYTIGGGTARTAEAGVPGSGAEETDTLPTVTRALQVAGGIKPEADVRAVEVRRFTRSGEEQRFTVNLWELLQTADVRQDALLQEGDAIFVPIAEQLSPEEVAALSSANFSPNSIRVNIVGEVQTPGVVELPPNSPLNQAIFQAGGFNTRARRREVTLVRLNPDGTVSRREIEVDFEQNTNDESNPALQNNDVVIIGRSGLAQAGDAVGNVLSPLGGLFSIFQLPFNFLRIFDND
jgi:polysaccharide export outer membrane protein